jgi:hypothetical protein
MSARVLGTVRRIGLECRWSKAIALSLRLDHANGYPAPGLPPWFLRDQVRFGNGPSPQKSGLPKRAIRLPKPRDAVGIQHRIST